MDFSNNGMFRMGICKPCQTNKQKKGGERGEREKESNMSNPIYTKPHNSKEE